MSIPAAEARTSRAECGGRAGGAGRSLPSTGGATSLAGQGDDRTDVRGRPHRMRGGEALDQLSAPTVPPPLPTRLFQPIMGKRGYSDVGKGSL